MVPNDLARRAASEDVHIDLLGSWPDLGLTLTWPEVRFWNWLLKVKKYMLRIGSTWPRRWCHFILSLIKKAINEKTVPVKNDNFYIWWRLEPKLLTLDQIWSWNVTEHEGSSPMFCFEFFLAIILLEIIAIVREKSLFSQNLTYGDLLGPQYWPDLKMISCKSLRSRRIVSYPVYHLSLSSVLFKIWRGGGIRSPSPATNWTF